MDSSDNGSVKSQASGRSAHKTLTPTGLPLLNIPTDTRTLRSSSLTALPAELLLKVKTQMGRIALLEQILENLPLDHSDSNLTEVLQIQAELEEIHKAFMKEHTFFEMTWPAAFTDHGYFENDTHAQEGRLVSQIRRALSRLKHPLSITNSGPVNPNLEEDSRFNSKLPDISLPSFDGTYAKWPAFSEMFTCLILENQRLTQVEKLHYLKGCLTGQPAQIISSLPLIGASLQPAWELLSKKYENKRLLIQSYLDMMFNITTTTQRNAASLNKLLATITEAIEGLRSSGVTEQMWDCILVHHVTRHLDSRTQEQWETSQGGHTEYPTFKQLEGFLTTRARALERIEAAPSATAGRNPQQGKPTRNNHAHAASVQPSQISGASQASTTPPSYPCDVCSASHFIISCDKFKELGAAARLQLAIKKRLCFNCLGRHSARACKSTRGCKKCSHRHHTMLHDMPPTASSYVPAPPQPTVQQTPAPQTTTAKATPSAQAGTSTQQTT